MKKVLVLLLALVLATSCIGSCLADDGVQAFDKNVTLTISVFDRGVAGGNAPDNNYWTEYIQKNFGDPRNITVKWLTIPRSEEVSKLNMLMSSGDAPDICFTYTESVVTNLVRQGGLVELTDLIDKYGPNIKSYLGDDILSAGMFEGGQYAVPARRIMTAGFNYYMREDMLTAAGSKLPTTKQEFYEALVAIKNKYGIAPLTLTSTNFLVPTKDAMVMSFIKDLSPRTLACAPAVTWDGFKDYLVYMNKLFNEGLIDPDFALDTERYRNLMTTSNAAAYTMHYDDPIRPNSILPTLQAYEPGAVLTAVECFESAADGTYYHPNQAPYGMMIMVPVTSKCPEAAVMYIDWLCREDVITHLQNGVEGINHTLSADGLPILQPSTDNWHFMNSTQSVDYTLTTNGQYFSDPDKIVAVQAKSYPGDYEQLYHDYFAIASRNYLNVVFHFDVVIKSESNFGTSLTALYKEIITRCTMCKPEELDGLFDKYVKQYLSEGGQAVWDEKAAAWDKAHQ